MKQILRKIWKYSIDPDYRFIINVVILRRYGKWDDERYLKRMFKAQLKKELNLEDPKTFNEKLQWLKLHDRKPIYTTMVDKYEVKRYVAGIIGGGYIIPTLGVWDRFDDIDFESLPNQFVLKTTHDSGGIVICSDKRNFNMGAARKRINKFLKRYYYKVWREWLYKNVKPRVVAEKYMEDASGCGLNDYKIWCFNGKPMLTLVCSDRFSEGGLRETFYDNSWNIMDMRRPDHPCADKVQQAPKNFELMKSLAVKLSKDIPFVRVDFIKSAATCISGS